MRVRLVAGSLGLVSLLFLLALLASSCSSKSSSGTTDTDGGSDASTDGGASDGADGGDGTTPASSCKLAELTGVADVTAKFLINDPPGTVPPTMTGGTLSGKYKVDKATLFLPTLTKGIADPTMSTGTVNSWAVFSGTEYRLYLKADFTIASTLGPQSQKADVVSQGGFTLNAAAVTLDYSCDVSPPAQAVEFTFTDNGSGRATLLIKLTTSFGDTLLQLDAAKN